MKKSEIALLILVVSVVAVATYFIVSAILGGAEPKPVGVEKAEVISPTVVEPSKAVFNENGINPTVKVKIGDQSGQQPFNIGQ